MAVPSVEEFQAAAEQYCDLVTHEEPIKESDIWTFRDLLLRLIFHITAVEEHPQGSYQENHFLENSEYQRVEKNSITFLFAATARSLTRMISRRKTSPLQQPSATTSPTFISTSPEESL